MEKGKRLCQNSTPSMNQSMTRVGIELLGQLKKENHQNLTLEIMSKSNPVHL